MEDLTELAHALKLYGADGQEMSPLDTAIVWIDWLDEEEQIIEAVAGRLQKGEALGTEWRGSAMFVSLEGIKHRLPLTLSRHDHYVVLSSLALLLEDAYSFLLLRRSLESERHGLLILSKAQARLLRSRLNREFTPLLTRLKPGHDYFFSIDIPYLHHEEHSPDFERERDEVTRQIEAARVEAGLDAGLSTNFTFSTDKPWWKLW